MGTRCLITVKNEGKYVIAQYGNSDGYPTGIGLSCLAFADSLSKQDNKNKFIEQLKYCRFALNEELDTLIEKVNQNPDEYPQFPRDASEILDVVMLTKKELLLNNRIDFSGDSLMCEWCYLIDLDLNTFEVFKGFNAIEANASHRFLPYTKIVQPPRTQYYPVSLVIAYGLDNLPTENDFIEYVQEEDE